MVFASELEELGRGGRQDESVDMRGVIRDEGVAEDAEARCGVRDDEANVFELKAQGVLNLDEAVG